MTFENVYDIIETVNIDVANLNHARDSFKKIVVVKDNIIPWQDENGIYYIGIEKFLLDENAMNG